MSQNISSAHCRCAADRDGSWCVSTKQFFKIVGFQWGSQQQERNLKLLVRVFALCSCVPRSKQGIQDLSFAKSTTQPMGHILEWECSHSSQATPRDFLANLRANQLTRPVWMRQKTKVHGTYFPWKPDHKQKSCHDAWFRITLFKLCVQTLCRFPKIKTECVSFSQRKFQKIPPHRVSWLPFLLPTRQWVLKNVQELHLQNGCTSFLCPPLTTHFLVWKIELEKWLSRF